jgi:ubiquinone/menaquinone biosynthesis C-methylase UbiE
MQVLERKLTLPSKLCVQPKLMAHRSVLGLEMDIRDLKFEDQSFDIVIDKGTMDALMCDRGDVWDPSPELIKEVKAEVDEVTRVLKIGGKFIYITFGQPHFRKRHLARDCWDGIKVSTLGEAFHYFIYEMKKQF